MRLLLFVPVVMAAVPCLGQQTASEAFLDRIWLSGQANFIRQQHGEFASPYSGPNSFAGGNDHATSRLWTLYTGFRISSSLAVLTDIESAGGRGLSEALGVAGFTNVDVVRNPSLGVTPYVSRVMLDWVLPLSKERIESPRGPLNLFPTLPRRRIEFRLGKMGTADFFDVNAIGSDSHLQFMNWATVNNGAYDYAADTRGYTYGLIAEYDEPSWSFRFGEMLMPKVANGVKLDWNLARARGENFELELRKEPFKKRPTTVRTLAFVNHANMGSYRQAIDGFLSGHDARPDVTAYRKQGRVKYGFGLNVEQQLTRDVRTFGRLGWNEGANESFAYTEVDRDFAFGGDLAGKRWRRHDDKIGAAFIVDAISGDHRRYLQLGGLGFILGDGNLRYGTERIFELYYNANVWHGISTAFDWQRITDPGYNRDRGPADVLSIRLHVEETLPLAKLAKMVSSLH